MNAWELAGGLGQQYYKFKHMFSKGIMLYFENIYYIFLNFYVRIGNFLKSINHLLPLTADLACNHMVYIFPKVIFIFLNIRSLLK